jgi:hypothetical protein
MSGRFRLRVRNGVTYPIRLFGFLFLLALCDALLHAYRRPRRPANTAARTRTITAPLIATPATLSGSGEDAHH